MWKYIGHILVFLITCSIVCVFLFIGYAIGYYIGEVNSRRNDMKVINQQFEYSVDTVWHKK